MAAMKALLLLACVAAAAVAPAAAQDFVDPNQQTEGISASLNGEKIAGNPLNLTAPALQGDQPDPPNGGFTMTSPHSTDAVTIDETQWSWEFDGYNVEYVGLTTMHNLKDPSWPVVWTIFTNASDTQYAPLVIDFVNITWLDEVAQNLTDGQGNNLGYPDFLAAGNDSAFGVVSRIASDPSQAMFGVLGNDYTSADALVGGINEPVNDDTFIPLTDEQLANLPNATELNSGFGDSTDSGTTSASAPTSAPVTSIPTPSSEPKPSSTPSPTPVSTPAPTGAASAAGAGTAIVAAVVAGAVLLLA